MIENHPAPFSVAYFGQGEGDTIGCVITGLPSKLPLDYEKDIIAQLNRTRVGYGLNKDLTTIELVSGIAGGAILGSPITIMAKIKREKDDTPKGPRSGTADYYFLMKYGVIPPFKFYRAEQDIKVAAGAFALKFLHNQRKLRIISWVETIGDLTISSEVKAEMQSECRVIIKDQIQDRGSFLVYEGSTKDQKEEIYVSVGSLKVMDKEGKVHFKFDSFDVEGVSPKQMGVLIRHSTYYTEVVYRETYKTGCPDPEMGFNMLKLIRSLTEAKDSVGGSIGCAIFGIPAGTMGVDSALAATMFSLHNMKGFEVGRGFDSSKMKLSEGTRKEIQPIKEESKSSELKMSLVSNAQGGVMSGISSGQPLCFRVGFGPPGGVGKKHELVSVNGTWQSVDSDPDYEACDIHGKLELIEGMAAISLIPLI